MLRYNMYKPRYIIESILHIQCSQWESMSQAKCCIVYSTYNDNTQYCRVLTWPVHVNPSCSRSSSCSRDTNLPLTYRTRVISRDPSEGSTRILRAHRSKAMRVYVISLRLGGGVEFSLALEIRWSWSGCCGALEALAIRV